MKGRNKGRKSDKIKEERKEGRKGERKKYKIKENFINGKGKDGKARGNKRERGRRGCRTKEENGGKKRMDI